MCLVAARSLQGAAATVLPPPKKKNKTEECGIAHSGGSGSGSGGAEGGGAEGGGAGGGGAEGSPQAAQSKLKPVPWAAFLARYRAAGQPAAGAGSGGDNTGSLGEFLFRTAEEFAAAAGGGGADAGVRLRLGEFLACHVEDAWLCGVLAYL
jgi:hypothetical protein